MLEKKVLVVDDLMPLRKIVKGHLLKMGFTKENVFEAADGEEGLAVVKSHPDLSFIITDWNMPNMSGVDMIKIIRQEGLLPEEVGIAVISGQDEDDSILEALSSGATGYIRKPISMSAIKELLESSGIL